MLPRIETQLHVAVLSLALAACGGSTASPDAAAAADAGSDALAPPLDGPASSIRVLVIRAEQPVQGATVVFHDAAGTVLGTALTDAAGRATGPGAADGQVTVALGASGDRQLLTYVGVQPGDDLTVVGRTGRDVSITLTQGNPGGGISVIAGNFNCSTNTSSATTALVHLDSECITGTAFPVLSTLSFAGDRYFSFKRGVVPAAAGTTSVTGLSAWTPGTAFTLDIANAPTTGTPRAYLGQIADAQSVAFLPEGPFSLTGGAGTATFSVADGYADAYQGELQIRSAAQGGFYQLLTFSKRFAGGSATQTLDLAAGMLPALSTVGVTNTDPARPVIAWTANASLAATDAGVATLTWLQPITGGSETIDWTFVVPPGTVAVTAPALPADVSAFAPTAASQLQVPVVAFFETDLLASYDAVRAQATTFGFHRVPLGDFGDATIPALPSAGTVRATLIVPE